MSFSAAFHQIVLKSFIVVRLILQPLLTELGDEACLYEARISGKLSIESVDDPFLNNLKVRFAVSGAIRPVDKVPE